MYFEGQPHDNLQEIIFSSNFTNTKVDDQYEKYTSDHRWFWASSKQDILIHEYIIDSFDKSSGISSFTTASESFSLSNEVVKVSGQIQVRTTDIEGKVTVTTTPVTKFYKRLKP